MKEPRRALRCVVALADARAGAPENDSARRQVTTGPRARTPSTNRLEHADARTIETQIDDRAVRSDLDIRDSSGSISVRNIDGSVTITDGSGSIDVAEVSQDLRILEAGSGSVSFHAVEGDVILD